MEDKRNIKEIRKELVRLKIQLSKAIRKSVQNAMRAKDLQAKAAALREKTVTSISNCL
jgi:phage shock protein A